MDENLDPQKPIPSQGSTQTGPLSSHEERQERREERRAERRAGRGGGFGWLGGVILIGVGILLILQNLGYTLINLTNWWAVFILLPAIGAFGAAWQNFKQNGRLTAAARGSLFGGLILVLVAAVFLFGLDWGILGPLVIILAGVGLLLNALLPG